MAYIYQIINDINGKVYIGKTEYSLEKRFREHCSDSQKKTEEHRPLYSAMRKYGLSHFHIELIEETDRPSEREVYWIKEKKSYSEGYNATHGGDGIKLVDNKEIVALYQNKKDEVSLVLFMRLQSVIAYPFAFHYNCKLLFTFRFVLVR